jgi:hypothetical protein
MPAVPFKANAKCRRHIPKQKRRLTNRPAYVTSLRQRGDLTVWFSEAAMCRQPLRFLAERGAGQRRS